MDNDLNATFEACNNFNKKLKDTIKVEHNIFSKNKQSIIFFAGIDRCQSWQKERVWFIEVRPRQT